MVKKTKPQKEELKKVARHRLIGAITLVLIVIVFLPMVLDKAPRPLAEDIKISIPDHPNINEGYLQSNRMSVEQEAAAATDSSLSQNKVKSRGATLSKESVRSEVNANGKQIYCVQLGVFQGRQSVNRLVDEVGKTNLPVYTESIRINGKSRTRVRIGPYPDKKAAQSVVGKIKKLKLKIGEPVVLLLSGKPS